MNREFPFCILNASSCFTINGYFRPSFRVELEVRFKFKCCKLWYLIYYLWFSCYKVMVIICPLCPQKYVFVNIWETHSHVCTNIDFARHQHTNICKNGSYNSQLTWQSKHNASDFSNIMAKAIFFLVNFFSRLNSKTTPSSHLVKVDTVPTPLWSLLFTIAM